MEKIKVLEVNNIDLPGRRFNGYDMIKDISDKTFSIKQTVITKQSDNEQVIPMLPDDLFIHEYYRLQQIEEALSIHNIFSVSTPALMDLPEYKEADIIHFHMFHNTKLSIYSLIKIAKEKKVVISLHDPWFITGRCVHFYNCDLWKNGCEKCRNLKTMFSLREDNCNQLWKLKKYVFKNIDIDIVIPSVWMKNQVKQSPILKHNKNIHLIPFGIDLKKFNRISTNKARKHFNFKEDEIVIFLRAQNEFKGTDYVLQALKELNSTKKVVVLTCENKGLLDEVKDKYKIIDLGIIEDKEMTYAMKSCDMFLMPSKGESFGMMAIEAMACSKPVIVFDNTALPSVVHAPKCGIAVEDRNAKALKEAIEYLIENPNDRKKRGELGRKICEKKYSVDRYNKDLKDLYKFVYNRKHEDIKTINIEPNTDIKEFLDSLKNGSKEPLKRDIDYSDPKVQEQIMIFNTENYLAIKKKSKSFKNILKTQIKKHKNLYKLIKKILRRN